MRTVATKEYVTNVHQGPLLNGVPIFTAAGVPLPEDYATENGRLVKCRIEIYEDAATDEMNAR